MATTFEWVAPEAIQTALSTDLNGLANGSYSAVSVAINNESDLYQFINLELYLASLTPVAGQSVGVYLLPSVDATNYVDGGGAVAPPAETLIAVFSLSTSAGAKWRAAVNIPIPPLSFVLVIGNLTIGSGVAFAANSNTLKYRRHNGQGV